MNIDMQIDESNDRVAIYMLDRQGGSTVDGCSEPRPLTPETRERIRMQASLNADSPKDSTYLERLYMRALTEIEQQDKMLVSEAFRRNRIAIDAESRLDMQNSMGPGGARHRNSGLVESMLSSFGYWRMEKKRKVYRSASSGALSR